MQWWACSRLGKAAELAGGGVAVTINVHLDHLGMAQALILCAGVCVVVAHLAVRAHLGATCLHKAWAAKQQVMAVPSGQAESAVDAPPLCASVSQFNAAL